MRIVRAVHVSPSRSVAAEFASAVQETARLVRTGPTISKKTIAARITALTVGPDSGNACAAASPRPTATPACGSIPSPIHED